MKKNAIKLLAVIVLVAAIIGISVIKSNISAKRTAEKITLLKEEYFRTRDSVILEQLDDTTRIYVDSIQNLESFYLSQIDSLNEYFANKESLLVAELNKQKTNKANTSPQKTKRQISKPSVSSNVKSDFNDLTKRLPGDLTSYEKRVSIDEIIIELSKKYKISPDEVRQIVGHKS